MVRDKELGIGIWNRACQFDETARLPGDEALGWALRFHGPAQNSGLTQSLELNFANIEYVINGFKYLGALDVADLLTRAAKLVSPDGDPFNFYQTSNLVIAQLQALEESYAIMDDDRLKSLFEACLEKRPQDFAPRSPA